MAKLKHTQMRSLSEYESMIANNQKLDYSEMQHMSFLYQEMINQKEEQMKSLIYEIEEFLRYYVHDDFEDLKLRSIINQY